jgi:hypothetical protein
MQSQVRRHVEQDKRRQQKRSLIRRCADWLASFFSR